MSIKFVLFFLLTTLAFILDCGMFFCYHDQFLYLVLCLYIFSLLNSSRPEKLLFLGALLCLESFMFYSSLWAPLLGLIPLTLVEKNIRHNFYQSWGYTLGVGATFIMAQMLIIEPFYLHIPRGATYTILKLCANILIVGLVSLKSFYQDKRDNRRTYL